jgi:hypothetical protein
VLFFSFSGPRICAWLEVCSLEGLYRPCSYKPRRARGVGYILRVSTAIWATSEPGAGSTFSFTLPVQGPSPGQNVSSRATIDA